jgi:hypothetical protein
VKVLSRIVGAGLALLVMAHLSLAQLKVGENTQMTANGVASFGYAGNYGDAIPSSHGLNLGFSGNFSGFYYNPSFLSFSADPYYNQSRADSDNQSLTGASGVVATANFFSGSHFPGSVSYHYDHNSTSNFGFAGQPNFTSVGSGQGFGVSWSALLPDMPTLSVGYSQGSGSGTLYGTDQETDSSQRSLSLNSTYTFRGWLLNGNFIHNSFHSQFPDFLVSDSNSIENSSGNSFGVAAQHSLPMNGNLSITYGHSAFDNSYSAPQTTTQEFLNSSNYHYDTETATATFHPTTKLTWDIAENYIGDLSGYLDQSLTNGNAAPGAVNLGASSHSLTFGGGVGYNFTQNLNGSAQATHYDQFYFGNIYSGTYLSGTVSYNKRILNLFTFSASVIDSSNGQGTNALGFVGYVNYFHRFGEWRTSGQFSYAQNVQSVLVTYTTSYYSYAAAVNRHLVGHLQWSAGFSGSRSALVQDPGDSNRSESFSTSLSSRRYAVSGTYTKASGISLLGLNGIITSPTPTPGLENTILFNGDSYTAGASVTPIRHLSLSGSFSRAISNTLATIDSHNDTEVFTAQMQYHLRRISMQAGYVRFSQAISAVGPPVGNTSYFVGISRWFDIF